LSTSEQFQPAPPQASAHWGFWATILWGFGIFAVFVMAQTISIVVAVLMDAGTAQGGAVVMERLKEAEKNGTLISIATYCSTIICCGAIAVAIAAKDRATFKGYLNLNSVSLRSALLWIGGMIAILVMIDMLTSALQRPVVPDFVAAVYKTSNPVWLIWGATVVAAPLFEEMFFRGFLFKGFQASVLGPAGAILLTSFLWAVIHLQYDLYGIVTIFLLGLIIGAARVATGSLYVPLAMHSITNVIATAEAAFWG
jgi:uncharacterized protein